MSQALGALVLAAGSSQRMGSRNKLTEEIDGQPLVARVVSAFEAAAVETIVVVTGYEASQIETALASHRLRVVHNPSHAEGMGTSIARGITALGDCAAAFIALGDLPRLEPATISALEKCFVEAEVRAYLDAAVRHWRARRDAADPDPLAAIYVDAFQSVRTSLFGECLAVEEAAAARPGS